MTFWTIHNAFLGQSYETYIKLTKPAQIASELLDEMQDPELTIDRALKKYLQLGYSENWINQRLKSIEIRKELADEWKKRGLKTRQ